MGFATITTQANPEAVPFVIAAAVAAVIVALAWRRRAVPGGLTLLVMMSGEAGWALFAAAELITVDLPIKRLWFYLKAGAAVLTILGLLAFVLRYTGHTRWLNSRAFAVICALAAAP